MKGAMFNRLGKVKGQGGGGNWFTDGRYLVRLEKITNDESAQGEGEFVAIESTILARLVAFENSKRPGERVSVVYMAKHGDVSIANVKSFIGTLCDMNPNAEDGDPDYYDGRAWAAAAEKAAEGAGTAFAGTFLVAEATTIVTKKNKKPFTKITWSLADQDMIDAFERGELAA
jgi:hypothetical protein